ncbi:replication-relaxation family protein [Streptomyces sp. NPDC058914]|uniref:replication-relaxation family protein n=1 Tax=Streptomyces sp. NPDC058914 TaxID=3346671 RepID=UPI0036B6CB6A
MATTEQMHLILSPDVRIEQTRRQLMNLRGEGLIGRVTLLQAGRTRVWHVTQYGAQVASECPSCEAGGPRGVRTTRLRCGWGSGTG